MKRFLKFGLPGLLPVLLAFPLAAGAGAFSDMGVIRPKVSMPAPDFTLTDMDGERRRLSDYRGDVVLIHFWATWCAPCRTEMPDIHRMSESFDDKGLKVLCVNVDRGKRQAVESFMQEIGLHFHTLLDPKGKARKQYEIFALPTSYIIGRDGKIIGRIVGERDWSSAKSKALIEYLLTLPGKAVKSTANR